MMALRNIPIVLLNKVACVFPDKLYLRLQFRLRMGYCIDFKRPQTLSEKIQWLKLNYKNPLFPSLVDKYSVKEYVSQLIGEGHIIPTLQVWSNPDEIDFDSLPQQFVLKTTHGGGNSGVIICKDKNCFDKRATIEKLRKALKQDIYKDFREWPYKFIKKRIIAEKYMAQEDGTPLVDYKFFCFNGIPRFIYVSQNIPGDRRTISAFLDMNWEMLPFKKKNENHAVSYPPKPESFDELKRIALLLANGFPFVRIDLYEINKEVYFSEYTFFPSSGMQPYEPTEWDRKLGDMLDLPSISQS